MATVIIDPFPALTVGVRGDVWRLSVLHVAVTRRGESTFVVAPLASNTASMAAGRPAAPNGPSKRRPLMKNAGVPLTPLRTPPAKSHWIFDRRRWLVSASRSSIDDSSILAAKAINKGTLTRCWLAYIESCIGQNRP